jgi:GTPase SAR1 family protein
MSALTSVEQSKYEAQRRLIDALRTHGVGHHLQLPQIAVVGDTSSGKSSLLSSISGIEFPSSSKLTTRCPTQLIMINASKFSGKVCVIRSAQSKDDIKFEEVNEIEDIPNVISKLTLELCGNLQQFTEDAISIEVKGPTFPNLTLIDLPGLIRHTKDGENPLNKDLVKNMVKKYISEERTIILAVAQANVDLHNTEILEYAAEVDPTGKRSFCVFTKMDLVDTGSERDVIDHINTNKTAMRFHIVKCRGQKDLEEKVSLEEALGRERKFFQDKTIWATSLKGEFIGIPNLKERLGVILQEIVSKSFPDVLRELNLKIKECQEKLHKFGPELTHSENRRRLFYEISEKIISSVRQGIKEDVSDLTKSIADQELKAKMSLTFRISKYEKDFKDEILSTRVVAVGDLQRGDRVEYRDVYGWKPAIVSKETPEKMFVLEDENKQEVTKSQKDIRCDLSFLKGEIEKKRGNRLPLFPIYEVFERLVIQYIEEWKVPSMMFLDQSNFVFTEFWSALLELVDMPPSLKISLRTYGLNVCQDARRACGEQMEKEFLREQDPYTVNHHYLFSTLDNLRLEPFKAALKHLSFQDQSKNEVVKVQAVLSLMHDLGGFAAPFEDREAVELNNALAAYIKVAKKRFADNVVLVVRTEFLKAISDRLSKLSYIQDDVLSEWLQEDVFTIQERERYRAMLSSLEEGAKEFNSLKKQNFF